MPGPIDEIEHTTSLGTWSLKRAQPDADFAEIVKEYWEGPEKLVVVENWFEELKQSRNKQ